MAIAADPLRLLARMALDDNQHQRVRAHRDGDHVEVSDGELHWTGSVFAWNHALHREAGLKAPTEPEVETELTSA